MGKVGENNYIPLNSDELKKNILAIENCWKEFISKVTQEYNKDIEHPIDVEYEVNALSLRELVERVHQRKDYFIRYHNGMKMSEFKEIGLNMFWLAKFKPFNITGNKYEDSVSISINEDFAMFYMLSALKNLSEELRKIYAKEIEEGKLVLLYDSDKLSGNLYDEILYSLCFRDIPKEAMGVLVELVANIVIPDIYKISNMGKENINP